VSRQHRFLAIARISGTPILRLEQIPVARLGAIEVVATLAEQGIFNALKR
jgi:hypothetical protein